jgi:DNA-binding transcriptional MerR regulator
MDKSPDAFRTISEVAEHLDTPAHVLRFWESRFPQIRPVKRAGGRRYYRPSDVALLTGIKRLLHDEGLTIRGVQKILRDHGVRHVAGLQDGMITVDDLGLVPVALDDQGAGILDTQESETAPEAAFAAVEADKKDEPPPAKGRGAAVQPPLPLFEAAAVSAQPWQPREDTTVATLLRALPRGALASRQSETQVLARRLAALRATLADRAEGRPG